MLVHHHTIVFASVRRGPSSEITCDNLRAFLRDLVVHIGMNELFEPIAIRGKYGFTGIVGIVTSHIAFHYFESDSTLQLDVYSCQPYDLQLLMRYIDRFWLVDQADILFVNRDAAFAVSEYTYNGSMLAPKASVSVV